MRTTSASRSVSPAGRSIRGARWPAASTTAVTASASSRPALACSPRISRRPFGRERRAVRARLGHRVVGVGGREQARGKRKLRAGRAAVVAGAVEALVVRSGNRRERRQELRAREDPLGVVRVEPHLLPLIRGQRPRLLPDPRVDRDPSEVVDERRAPKRGTPASSIRQRRAAAAASSATPAE